MTLCFTGTIGRSRRCRMLDAFRRRKVARMCTKSLIISRPQKTLHRLRTSLAKRLSGQNMTGSPGLIRTGGRPINSRMLYR